MPNTFYNIRYRLFVYNISGSEFHPFAETLVDQTLYDLDLHLTHDLRMDFREALIPDNVELRDFFF